MHMRQAKWLAYLEVGRVSNLPTVLTNIAVGITLSGGVVSWGDIGRGVGAVVSFYVGGMYLNDYWDRHFDRLHRLDRPIPSGRVSERQVGVISLTLFLVAVILLSTIKLETLIAGLLLLSLILIYNRVHKKFQPSPFIMAGCRFMVYVIGALISSEPLNRSLLTFGAMLFAYLTGLTYTGRLEHLNQVGHIWPLALLFVPALGSGLTATNNDNWKFLWIALLVGCILMSLRYLVGKKRRVSKGIGILIAGISLVDALFLATLNRPEYALLATLCFGLTLMLHRIIPGT